MGALVGSVGHSQYITSSIYCTIGLRLSSKKARQRFFRLLAWGYAYAEKIDSDRMEWEYYRLRLREAQLLGGVPLEYLTIRTELLAIRDSYAMVHNQTQLGNPHVYLALLD